MSSWQQEFNVGSENFNKVKMKEDLELGEKYLILSRGQGPREDHIAKFIG